MKDIIKQLDTENKKTVKTYERNIKDLNVKLKKTPGFENKATKLLSKSKEKKPKSTKMLYSSKLTKSKTNIHDSPKSVKSVSKNKSKSKIKKNEESKFSVSQNDSDYYSSRNVDSSQIRNISNLQPVNRYNDNAPLNNLDMLSPISNGII